MGVFHLVNEHTIPDQYLAPEQWQTEPAIEPGQIWLVECAPASLSAVHARLLARANVVLYERPLLAALAAALPIGIYAEPLPAAADCEPVIAPRALQFAADGWSVLQLVERHAGWRRRLPSLADELYRSGCRPPLLALGRIAAGRFQPLRGTATTLASIAAELGADELLSLTVAAPSARSEALAAPRVPAHSQAFTANGLAG